VNVPYVGWLTLDVSVYDEYIGFCVHINESVASFH